MPQEMYYGEPEVSTEFTTELKDLTFSEALELLKSGKKLARAGWNGKGQWVALMGPLHLPPHSTPGNVPKVNDRTAKFLGDDTPMDSQPYFVIFTAQGKWQPGWVASQSDLLANDWCVVE